MPPIVASALTWAFILYLFRRDFRERPNVTRALWVPTLWIWLITTRATSEWINTLFRINLGAKSLEAGSPFDGSIYFGLLLSAFLVLRQRQVSVAEVLRRNSWLMLFLAWGFLSIVWSDYPFVSLKRWVKVLGHPMMALVILTEPDPLESFTRLMKRCAYLVLPISILFIKYYPQYGRGFDGWTGAGFNTGITDDKNALGYVLMILGSFFIWHFMRTLAREDRIERRGEVWLCIVLLGMLGWLFTKANSKTPLLATMVGVGLMMLTKMPAVRKDRIGTYLFVFAVLAVTTELMFGVSGTLLKLIGRDATLTGRTELWVDLLKVKINPLLGAGFESFWLGERLTELWKLHPFRPNQAHNGYLETYLNLGLIGLFILIGAILSTFWKARFDLIQGSEFGRFRLGFLVAVIVFNWTEASFKTLHAVWFLFYIAALRYPSVTERVEEDYADDSARGLENPLPA